MTDPPQPSPRHPPRGQPRRPRVTLLTGGARSGKSSHALELVEAMAPASESRPRDENTGDDAAAGGERAPGGASWRASGGGPRRAFVATSEALDDEMRARIAAHQRQRGAGWLTVEAPLDLAGALRDLPATVEVAVVDCLTVWLSNLLRRQGRAPETTGSSGRETGSAVPPQDLELDGAGDGGGDGAVEADVEAGVEAGVEAAMEMDVEAAMEVDVEAAMEATLEAAVADLLQVLEAPPCELVLVTNEVGLGIVPVNAVGRRFRDRAGALNQQVARRAHVVKLLVCGQPLVVKGA